MGMQIETNECGIRIMLPEKFEVMFPIGLVSEDLNAVVIARKVFNVAELCRTIANDPRLTEDQYQLFLDICHENLTRLLDDIAIEALADELR